MSYFRYISTATTGAETHVTGITDVTLLETDNGLVIYSASGRDGGIIARDETLQVIDTADYRTAGGLGAEAQLHVTQIAGRDALLVSGPLQAGLSGYWLNSSGLITGRFDLVGPRAEAITAFEMVEIGGQDFWFTAARGTAGITAWQQGAEDTLVEVTQFNVALQEAGNDVFALEHVERGARDYLLAVSAEGDGLYNYTISSDGRASLVDYLDMSAGLSVNTPTELAQVELNGTSFILVGAAGTSSISVITVSNDGQLRATDQVNDDLNTRFQNITLLETIVVGGIAFVVAGGGDDGLSLMTLLPTGRLVHLQTIAHEVDMALINPAAVVLAEENGMIVLYTAGLSGDAYGSSGVGRFE
ncbi:MAG: hypothetical protein ABJJ03_05795, partial [Sulfitobacter sp.]